MRSTRVAVISDLHLGGEKPYMTSRPERLAEFIARLPSECAPDEDLELVIDGDFVDFLAITPWAAFTPNPAEAIAKLRTTMEGQPFGQVFDALGRHVAAGHRLTILIGNHDPEFCLPQVQDALLARLGAAPHQVRWFADGRAYRVGTALIEHGNRYEHVNANDWSGLRALASALSRDEAFEENPVRASIGSNVVAQFINPLKRRYPFIELLKPSGELVALLLAAFEPSILLEMEKLAWLMRDDLIHRRNPKPPGHIARRPLDQYDVELAAAFGAPYDALARPRENVEIASWLGLMVRPHREGVAAMLERGEPIPPKRLAQIRLLLLRLLLDDRSDRPDGPTEAWGEAAQKMLRDSRGALTTVVMGHTHLPRHIGPAERALYINTGTWADVVRVPNEALVDGADEQLTEFLRRLYRDERTPSPATWADLRIEPDGTCSRAKLRAE